MLEKINSTIPEYFPSTKKVYISQDLGKIIENQHLSVEKWLFKSIKLGLMIEESEVYQEVGVKKDLLKLRINDFIPYIDNPNGEKYSFDISQEYINRIQKCLGENSSNYNIDKWIRRALFLGINQDQMVFFQKNEQEYNIINFKDIDISDI